MSGTSKAPPGCILNPHDSQGRMSRAHHLYSIRPETCRPCRASTGRRRCIQKRSCRRDIRDRLRTARPSGILSHIEELEKSAAPAQNSSSGQSVSLEHVGRQLPKVHRTRNLFRNRGRLKQLGLRSKEQPTEPTDAPMIAAAAAYSRIHPYRRRSPSIIAFAWHRFMGDNFSARFAPGTTSGRRARRASRR